MKVIFTGTPKQIKREMEEWLINNQLHNELNKQELLNNVSIKLRQHNIKLTQNENDLVPLGFVKQVCQLDGHDWKIFKHELEACGVNQKRTTKTRMLTNLKLIEED